MPDGPLSASPRTDRFDPYKTKTHGTKKHTPRWVCVLFVSGGSDRNRTDTLIQNLILSQARLPVPPQSQNFTTAVLFCSRCFCSNLFNKACTACRFVNRFFRRCCCFPVFLFNSFLNSSHFRCQTRYWFCHYIGI